MIYSHHLFEFDYLGMTFTIKSKKQKLSQEEILNLCRMQIYRISLLSESLYSIGAIMPDVDNINPNHPLYITYIGVPLKRDLYHCHEITLFKASPEREKLDQMLKAANGSLKEHSDLIMGLSLLEITYDFILRKKKVIAKMNQTFKVLI